MTRPTRIDALLILVTVVALGFASLGSQPTADLVLYNGRVVTMIADGDVHEAIAVSGNRILYVGSNTEALAFAGSETDRIDLGGRAVLHNLFVRDDLLPRYEELGIVAAVESMTSCFATFYRDLLPLEYKHIVRRWGDLVATGAHVTADSD